MQIMIGQSARKENFWQREKEIKEILHKINSHQHILLVAPRRVGKTSLMHYLLDNQAENVVLYIDTESANSENEFWKKLFNKLMDEEFINTLQNRVKNLGNKLKTFKISEITTKGIKFGESEKIEYIEAFKEIIKNLDIDKNLVIMIDEFAQTIENIIKYESVQSAKSLLTHHRELRQDRGLSEKITFIYAGSIGLESVASKLESISAINDLAVIKVPPLTQYDAKNFVETLAKANNINIDEQSIIYMLKQIEWLIPFYIQLVMDELRKLDVPITNQIIDNTFKSLLDNKNYFEHWHTRLKSFDDNEYKFAKEVLNFVSENNIITSSEILNIATKYTLIEDTAKEVRNSLVYDGYINNNDNIKEFRFNSPILKMWWYKNVAN